MDSISIEKPRFNLFKSYCQQQQWFFEEYTQPRKFEYLIPGQQTNSVKKVQAGLAHVFLACMQDVTVFGEGFVLAPDNNVFVHGITHMNHPDNIKIAMRDSTLNLHDDASFEIVAPIMTIEEECILVWALPNFGHWLFQMISRLAMLKYKPELKSIKLLVRDYVSDVYIDYLLKLGFKREQLIFAPATVCVKKLWVPSVVMYQGHYHDYEFYFWPDAIRFMRQQYLGDDAFYMPSIPKGEATCLYMRRTNAKFRRVKNEDEVIAMLKKYGFDCVDMSNLPCEEQLNKIKSAEIIIYPSGADCVMTMFAPLDATVIQIQPKATDFDMRLAEIWHYMSNRRLIRHYAEKVPLPAEEVDPLLPYADFDMRVDISELESIVQGYHKQYFNSGLVFTEGLTQHLFK